MAIHKTVAVGDMVKISVACPTQKGVAIEGALVTNITGSILSASKKSMSVCVDMSQPNVLIELQSRQVTKFLVFSSGRTSNIAYDTAEEAHEAAKPCYGSCYQVVKLEGQWRL